MTFGETLRQLMADRGLSLRKLARISNYDVGYLSKVRNGLWPPSQALAERLDEVLEADGRLLALASTPQPAGVAPSNPDEEERLALAVRDPARVDAAVVDSLAATIAAQRRIEDMIGSAPVLDPATSHLSLILRLLREARGRVSARLAATASGASQFAGWLSTATGSFEQAGVLYDQALRLGLQAGDNDLAATALSMRGHLAWNIGDVPSMVDLSRAAADMATAAGTRAVAIQQGGRALAIMGDRQGALRAVALAEEMLSQARGDAPDSLYFYGPEMLTMQRGLILGYLAETPAQHAAAADLITAGVQALPASVRDAGWVAWYRARAAAEHAAAADVTGAVAGLRSAVDAVTRAGGYRRALEEVARTRSLLLRRWPDHPDLPELIEGSS